MSAENVPLELQKKRHDAQETEVEPLDVSQSVESNRSKRINYDDEVSLRIRVRYILILEITVALLFVALSVVSTILVMQSC